MDVVASISDRMGDLGGYLREQREHARLSVRQLASLAGVSNPYLSQVERGLRRPSAEVLQQIARGLRISAEALYVRAGILDEEGRPGVEAAVHADPDLNERQRRVLLDIYASFRAENRRAAEEEPEPERVVVRRRVPSGASRRAAGESPVDDAPTPVGDAATTAAPVQPDVDEPDAVRPSAASRPQRATRKAATAKKSATATKGATAKKAVTATKTTTARRSAAVRRTPAGQAPAEQAAEQATTEQATDDRTPDTEGGPSDGRS